MLSTLESLQGYSDALKDRVNELCDGQPAWKIVLLTAGGTLTAVYIHDFLCKDQPLVKRVKQSIFRLVRKIPSVRRKIETEIAKVHLSMSTEMNDNVNNSEYVQQLPSHGWTDEKIMTEVNRYNDYGKCNWAEGYASGTVYNGSPELTDLMTRVYGVTSWTNPLHCDVFPGIRKMEAEVVRMCCAMFNGGKESCGTMSMGGTESIVMACKAYRDYAMNVRGVAVPEILAPVTAHAAFEKASQLLNIPIRHVPVDPDTQRVNVAAMRRMITRRTCMLVGSAPQFPHGVIDPIAEISALGVRYNIPVHVDACLGGFLIPFMEEAGYPMPLFDFRLPGVTSISCDTHKYGFAPKGSSVIMYRNTEYRHHQFFTLTEWPGGIYATPTIGGSRPGGIIAACWAALMSRGRDGYVASTRLIIQAARAIERECRLIPGLRVVSKPDVSVVALASDTFNIYSLSDRMTQRGWNLNALQYPACIHIAVTMPHTKTGVVDRFIRDMRELSLELSQDKECVPTEGAAVLYGMAQSLPDRSIVEDIACCYLDATYSTEGPSEAG